jgi:hypothetical protein
MAEIPRSGDPAAWRAGKEAALRRIGRLTSRNQPGEDPMAPYPTPTPVIDAFAASRSILDRIITRLGDEDMTEFVGVADPAWRPATPVRSGPCEGRAQ